VTVDEHTIEVAGSPVFYRTAGATAPEPVVYLHGVPTSSDDWLGLLERTGGIAPDLIGFGRSGKGGHLDYSIQGYATFLERLLDHLRIERLRLVAHDWGAVPGLVFAQRHPDRVTRVVLVDAIPLLDGFHWHGPARLFRRPLLGELAMGGTNRWLLARTLRRGGPWSDERIATVYDQLDQGTQRAILRLHRAAGEPELAAAGRDLHNVTAPALILWGERDPWLNPQLADRYATALPARVRMFPNAGHWPWLEDPAAAEAIAEFLA
jgi:pimeloyl-ACP methyl ester carboxylesterase